MPFVRRVFSQGFTSSALQTIATVPVGVSIPAGETICVGFDSNDAPANGALSIADSKGNFVAAGATAPRLESRLTSRAMAAFSCVITVPLVAGDTITVSVAATGANRRAIIVDEFTNLSALGATGMDSNSNSQAANSGPTTPRPGESSIMWGLCGWNNGATGDTFDAGAGFAATGPTIEAGASAAWRYLAAEFGTFSGVGGTDPATGTINPAARNWTMMALTFPEAGGGSGGQAPLPVIGSLAVDMEEEES